VPLTDPLTGHAAPERVRRFRLQVVEGPETGQLIASEGRPMVVGTHASADLVLTDRSVSRFHCEIALEEGTPVVRDLDSRNGIWVDGVRLFRAPLADGSHIGLGKSRLRLSLGTETIALPMSDQESFGALVGRSPVMRSMFLLLERAAASDATVLLEGETGTGKELAAESIHRASARADGPFVVVDCGSLPPELVGPELFGHVRGAFTGAVGDRAGAFEAAGGGTIFLDEIGELTSELQPMLLRALEQREVRRVGSEKVTPVDVRVVAATNRDLRAEVNAGRFRADLYYRLAVLSVRLPALRERARDLPLLVARILEDLGAADRPEARRLTAAPFLQHLVRHSWPGNVRELRNHVERCLLLDESGPVEGESAVEVEPAIDIGRPFRPARDEWLRIFERRYLGQLLAAHEGNVREAARAAGIDRIYFYRMLWKHGLK
jgi:DNA-binding NtrC family response regulator